MLVLQALWLFLPALIGNQFPGFAAVLLPQWNRPISVQWLGNNKTWLAYPAAIFGAVATIYLQRDLHMLFEDLEVIDYYRSDLWLVGVLCGVGVVVGDQVKSFFKRLRGIQSGVRWLPWDRLDMVIGWAIFTAPVAWVGWEYPTIIAVLFYFFIHPIGNHVGYWLRIRKVPW